MSAQRRTRLLRLAPAARRVWWALLILIHIPVIGSVARSLLTHPDGGSWFAFAALTLTVLLFVGKLLDAPFLRFRTTRSAALAFLLVCALVHHEAAASEAGREVLKVASVALVAAVAVEGFRRSTRRLRQQLLRQIRKAYRRLAGALGLPVAIIRSWTAVRQAQLRLAAQILDARVCIPRAPPA